MEMVTQSLIYFGILLTIVQTSSSLPHATINGSKILGRTITITGKNVSEFLGIRYAKPPVHGRRFQKPEPSSKYPTEFYAFNPPPSCWQLSEYQYPWYDDKNQKSEDCLFLNIWAPRHASANNKKAVIFWIHAGGSFRYGSIQQDNYYGALLSGIGDVVVVTPNYRVGPFGFLSSGTDDAPGNAGLYDILEALQWVNKNIEAFGGDTSKITIAGQSTGSIAVGLLTVSPLAKGLFHRQIMVSGSPAVPDANNTEANLRVTQDFAERLHCANKTFTVRDNPSQVVKCLKNKPAALISEIGAQINSTTETFIPQHEDELLPLSPLQSIIDKNMQCSEVLIGNVLDEGSFIVSTNFPNEFGFFGNKNYQPNYNTADHIIRSFFKDFQGLQTKNDEVVSHYLNQADATKPGSIRKQVYNSIGDAYYLCPTVYYAEQCASNGGKVYYYLWKARPSDITWASWMGVAHLSDASFVSGRPIRSPTEFKKTEETLSTNLIEIWSSFAKYGKPSIPWPLFSNENRDLVYLGPGPVPDTNGTELHKKNCDFFRPYYGF